MTWSSSESGCRCNRLAVCRDRRGLSHAELAGELSVSRQTVVSIETGKYDPSLPLASAIARSFRVAIVDVFPAALLVHGSGSPRVPDRRVGVVRVRPPRPDPSASGDSSGSGGRRRDLRLGDGVADAARIAAMSSSVP